MTDKPLVSVIIPTMNRKDEVIECLDFVAKSNYPSFEVIVVDDASSDNTPDEIRRIFDWVHLIVSPQNNGAAISRNLGANYATGKYLFFLDSDAVINESTIENLINGFDTFPNAGMVSPIIYYYDDKDKIWYAGATINLLTSKAKYREIGKTDVGQFNQMEIIPSGHAPTAFMVKAQAFQDTGGFDINFYMGFEESDLAKRIETLGYAIVFNPGAKAWHRIPTLHFNNPLSEFLTYTSYRNSKIAYHTSKNRISYMRRYAGKTNFSLFLAFFLPASIAIYTMKCILGWNPGLLTSIFRGTFDGLKSGPIYQGR